MAINGTRMQQVAMRLLRDNCQIVQYRRNDTTSFNPLTGEAAAIPSTTYTGYGNPSVYRTMDTAGTTVLESGTRLIMATDEEAPLVNDIFTIDEKEYTALSVQKMNAAGTTVCYIVQLTQ